MNKRILVVDEQLLESLKNQPTKAGKLQVVLERTFLYNCWVSNEKIMLLTRMSSFNQRIQRLRDGGTKIEAERNGAIALYQLQSNPNKIEWDAISPRNMEEPQPSRVAPAQRAPRQPAGKPAERISQENLL